MCALHAVGRNVECLEAERVSAHCGAVSGSRRSSDRKERFKERRERRSDARISALKRTGGVGAMVPVQRLVLTWTERVSTTDTAASLQKNSKRSRQEVRGKRWL